MSYSDARMGECKQSDTGQQNVSKVKWYTLVRMLQMMRFGFWKYLTAIVAMSIALTGFDTVTAFFLKDIISRVGLGGDMFTGFGRSVLTCICAGFACLAIYGVGYCVYTMEAKKAGVNLQKIMFSKAMRLPFSYYENSHSGDFMSKIMYDCERAQGIYGSRFRRILMPCLMVIGYLIPMFYLSWQVTLCLFGTSTVLLIINAAFVSPIQKLSRKLSGTHGFLTERLTNILSGIEQIKIFGLQDVMVQEYSDVNLEYKQGKKKLNRMSAWLAGLNQGFHFLGLLVFIAFGIFLVSINITTVDSLAAIYVLYGSMSWNLLQVGSYIPSMASYLTNAKRVFEFLDLEEEPEIIGSVEKLENTEMVKKEYSIYMDQVSFSYDGENQVLEHFNLCIPKGKCIALKGESGKGKSTIAKLLLGFYPVTAGRIYLNGKEYGEYRVEEIRRQIGYVPQEPYLYNVTIEENIRYGKPEASREEIICAAKMANAHDFIMRREHGYDTVVGERGNHLSGGEKQRIAIARAILKDAPILILDEATAALDNESEALVNEALERLMVGRTTIVIAHRKSTLDRADEIVEIS